MSWWGGGEIRATPGWVWRSRAISAETLWPGSWPPSPGLEPWAILICSSPALGRDGGVERDGQGLVGLGGQRAQAHGRGREAGQDVGRRLDLVQGQGRTGWAGIQPGAQGGRGPLGGPAGGGAGGGGAPP